MQRFTNNPDDIVDETLRGFVRAHSDRWASTLATRVSSWPATHPSRERSAS